MQVTISIILTGRAAALSALIAVRLHANLDESSSLYSFRTMSSLAVSPFSSLAHSIEPWIWLLALVGYLRAKGNLLSLFLGVFLGVRTAAAFALTALFLSHSQSGLSAPFAVVSFYISWAGFLAGFVLLLFSLREIFHHIISPLPGLAHVGGIVFRWVALVSLLLSAAVGLPSLLHPRGSHIYFVLLQIATDFCALELCLLAFLLLVSRALGFSLRSRVVGICVGFMLLALADIARFSASPNGTNSVAAYISNSATILCLAAWILYFALPEPAREFAHTPLKTLMRWNDLALALHPPEQPAEEHATGFLQDVESVVDRVLARNASKTS